ncbi:nucleotide exchange factor GrpE [Rickettsiella endosymbiont of Miltochrista miniata]|uniref:nucleotide exchange factor GrpE n=1 Tax=Rickettsiella endosymbiont of Miltochrista miniata TaxID=3066239 RepID=UPI00313DC23D
MAEKEPSKKSTWEKLNIAAKQDSSTANEKKAPSAEKEELEQEKQLTHPSYEALEAQLLETENRVNDYKSQLAKFEEQKVYQLAEMDNIQRRTKRDIENAYKFSLEKFIKELLPVKDSLETALDHAKAEEQDTALSGIQLTLKQLQSLLEKNGVKSIEPAGKPFDSHFHEAMLAEENDELAPNTVIRVLQKGYLLHERLIRPALVVVTKAKEKTS